MFKKALGFVVVVCLAVASQIAIAQTAATKPDDQNAALAYWSVMYRLNLPLHGESLENAVDSARELSEREDGGLRAKPTPEALVESGDLAAWLDKIQPELDELATASESDRCDFGLQWQDGYDMKIVHTHAMRRAMYLSILDARRHAEAGRPAAAATRLATVLRIGSHLTHDGEFTCLAHAGVCVSTVLAESRWLLAHGGGQAEREVLLSALAEFGDTDPFNSAGVLRRERQVAKLHPEWLREGGLEGLFKSIELVDRIREDADPVDLDEIEANGYAVALARSYLSDDPEQEAENLQRAWDEVIEAWEQPDALEQLQAIVQRANDGDFGPAARLVGPLTVTRMWRMDRSAREDLYELRELLGTGG